MRRRPVECVERGPHAQERPEAVHPPTALEALRSFVGQRRAVQHAGVVAQRRQSTELVHHMTNGCGPLLRRCHVERDRDHLSVIEFLDAGFQLVGQHIARGDPEAVLV